MNNDTRNPNGQVLPFSYVIQHKEELLPVMSEGSEHLYRILDYCINNNFPTIACCAGHNLFDAPYITIEYNEKDKRQLNAVLNRLRKINGINIMFSTRGQTSNNFNVTVYTSTRNRDLVFNTMATILESGLEEDILIDDYKIALDLALEKDNESSYTSITIFNSLLKRKYMLSLGMYDLDNDIVHSIKKFKIKNPMSRSYIYKLSKGQMKMICSQILSQAMSMKETVHENERYSNMLDSKDVVEMSESTKTL